MPVNPKKKAIKEAKFIKALVDNAGNATKAYKAIIPQSSYGTARTSGSTTLAKIDTKDIDLLYEKIGCTKDAVLTELWERMKQTNTQQFVAGTRVLSKIAGWETKSNGLRDLLDRDLDLIEVVKIRLKKRSDTKDLRNTVDVDVISTSTNSDEKQDSDEGIG